MHQASKLVPGYSLEEFAETLGNSAEGRVDADGLISGQIAIDAVPQAFADLADPQLHAKIMAMPGQA